MPECRTRYFESVEYAEDSTIQFPQGLPGFEEEREFVLIEQASHNPLLFLQSLKTPELCFIVLPVLAVAPDYVLNMRTEDLRVIGLRTSRQPRIGVDIFCGGILAANDDEPTANLMAPIVINLNTRVAVQAIQVDNAYSYCHGLASTEMVVAC